MCANVIVISLSLKGNADVPIANCNGNEYSSHPKATWKLHDYLIYWNSIKKTEQSIRISHGLATTSHGLEELLYMKDWHFSRYIPYSWFCSLGFKFCGRRKSLKFDY